MSDDVDYFVRRLRDSARYMRNEITRGDANDAYELTTGSRIHAAFNDEAADEIERLRASITRAEAERDERFALSAEERQTLIAGLYALESEGGAEPPPGWKPFMQDVADLVALLSRGDAARATGPSTVNAPGGTTDE